MSEHNVEGSSGIRGAGNDEKDIEVEAVPKKDNDVEAFLEEGRVDRLMGKVREATMMAAQAGAASSGAQDQAADRS